MKSHAHPVTWGHRAWSNSDIGLDQDRLTRAKVVATQPDCEPVPYQRAANRSLAGPMRIVGVLAFCQTIFFLVLFLFLCARAGAATENPSAPNVKLTLSTYTTKTVRDPFGSQVPMSGGPATAGVHSVSPDSFKLMGILYSPASPAALINGQLVELNKPVRVQTAQGETEIKALVITREMVQLEAGGQKVELRLGTADRDKESK